MAIFGNLTLAPRDQFVTVNIKSFEPSVIIDERLWVEGPVQVLNTFMSDETFFVGVGNSGRGGLSFDDRLAVSFGEEKLDRTQGPIDLREYLSDQEIASLLDFVQRYSYRSLQPCPHDYSSACTFAVGWNRERTRERGMRMFVTRVSEDVYLIVDDSILGQQQ